MRGGEPCLWRGVWLEEGLRAAGVVAREMRFTASERDPLTGLLDRRSFMAAGPREAEPSAGGYELVVADLNRLRRLNEALGHERADLVLAALGSRLAAAFPEAALMARIGEDEFAVLAPKSETPSAEMLRAALEQPLRVAGFDIHPTLSIGEVTVEGGDDAPEAAELLRRAELAIEVSKAAGRGAPAAAYGRALESDGLSRLALEADLRGSIERGEIVAFFQPIVRLSTGELSGFEALARWRHPRRGFLAPDDFLRPDVRDGHDGRAGRPHDARLGPPARRLAARPPGRRPPDLLGQPLHRRDRPRGPGRRGGRPGAPERPAAAAR